MSDSLIAASEVIEEILYDIGYYDNVFVTVPMDERLEELGYVVPTPHPVQLSLATASIEELLVDISNHSDVPVLTTSTAYTSPRPKKRAAPSLSPECPNKKINRVFWS